MTDTLRKAVTGGDEEGGNPAVDRLREELEGYLAAQAQRLLVGLGSTLGSATTKLNDMADGEGPGLSGIALAGGRKALTNKLKGEKGGFLRGVVEEGAGRLKENVTGALKGLTGSKKRKGKASSKPTVILEYVDVGVPVREAYNQWTQLQEFSEFAKGVRGVSPKDDTTSDWNLKIFWSSRSWQAKVTEQIPDERIAWTSEGAKGTTKGVVTFHPLGENLTRVLLLVEYHPKGLFEKTGNIWRAQGRRVRLDLKHFARHVSMRGEATGAWRGEIQDGEVVVDHDEAVEREEEEAAQDGGDEAYAAEDAPDGEAEDGYDEEGAYEDGEDGEDGEAGEDGAYEDDDAAGDEALDDGEPAEDDEPVDDEGEPLDEYEDEGEPVEDEDGYDDEPAEDELEDVPAEDRKAR
ncbi:SRPBCC family protein [Actinacidiphila acidipaludis]|uniref:SRPBCC family protein n=1 Tax=Actinacidiphila acidipaludis TaxID=2873382 RepID=UPI0027DFC5F8|nr:SRPBCC family protein [Streptomyces acidipaludis]